MAERNGSALRRRLRSAERLSERAIARGSFKEKTPLSRSRALLVSVTCCDQRLVFLPGERDDRFDACLRIFQRTRIEQVTDTGRTESMTCSNELKNLSELELLYPVIHLPLRLIFCDTVALLNLSH
jgi:hypothetical protein